MRQRHVATVYDAAAWVVSLFIAAVLRFEFNFEAVPFPSLAVYSGVLVALSVAAGFATHLSINRYVVGSVDELKALALAVLSVIVIGGIPLVLFGNQWGIPRSLVFIAGPFALLLSGVLRGYWRFSRRRPLPSPEEGTRALIYGAGAAAELLVPQLLSGSSSRFRPVVLVDDSPEKARRWISGVPVGGTWKDFAMLVRRHQVEAVVVAIPSASAKLLSDVRRDVEPLGLPIAVLPSVDEYLLGRSNSTDLRAMSSDDLLGREPVELDSAPISSLIAGKTVLVTGGGGSIGSELARQIASLGPSSLTLADQDESRLLSAAMAAGAAPGNITPGTYLLNIRDKEGTNKLFHSLQPEVVFHAAALKHVSFLEEFPAEAWKTNVEGTLNLLEASAEVGVRVFVNISTDKAAAPISSLGRSKKLAEQLTAWFGSKTDNAYVSVRFGNVLGSRGSLVPVISEQISRGGPVTITDESATRFFMSVSEASQLVLQAAAEGEKGDILLLDMGDPVRVADVARKMIELSGKRVEIAYVGLRPGEKLHEELVSEKETLLPAQHPKLFKISADPKSPQEVNSSSWL